MRESSVKEVAANLQNKDALPRTQILFPANRLQTVVGLAFLCRTGAAGRQISCLMYTVCKMGTPSLGSTVTVTFVVV